MREHSLSRRKPPAQDDSTAGAFADPWKKAHAHCFSDRLGVHRKRELFFIATADADGRPDFVQGRIAFVSDPAFELASRLRRNGSSRARQSYRQCPKSASVHRPARQPGACAVTDRTLPARTPARRDRRRTAHGALTARDDLSQLPRYIPPWDDRAFHLHAHRRGVQTGMEGFR